MVQFNIDKQIKLYNRKVAVSECFFFFFFSFLINHLHVFEKMYIF